MKYSLRSFLLSLFLYVGLQSFAFASEITVYKSPTCGCCKEWVKHLQGNGLRVIAHDVPDLMLFKRASAVPVNLEACHTAIVEGYVIEGHVPASDIKRLLKSRPPILGLAVPGMPVGSPGMEQGGQKDHYDVLSFDRQGKTGVFARY